MMYIRRVAFRITGPQVVSRWNGTLVKHHDPPRTNAPDIFNLEAKPSEPTVDLTKLDKGIGRIREFPPPRIRIVHEDYEEPSVVLRAIDKAELWVRGSLKVLTNFEILYELNRTTPEGGRTREDAKIVEQIHWDSFKSANFLAALFLFPPYALFLLLFGAYNPFSKPSTLQHPRDTIRYLRKVCPPIGSYRNMMEEFIGLDSQLLQAYEEEFDVDFETHCISADDAIRLFPYTRLALSEVAELNHYHLVHLSHAFPCYMVKTRLRTIGFFNHVCEHIGKMLLEDRMRGRSPGTEELTTVELWNLCYNRGLFWTTDGKELTEGQLMYLYSQWMKLALIKQKNKKTLELCLFFIIFNVGRNVIVPDAKPSDWEFVERFFHDFAIGAQMGATGTM